MTHARRESFSKTTLTGKTRSRLLKPMRMVFFVSLLLLLGLPGCAGRKGAASPAGRGGGQNVIVTPSNVLVGKIVSVNPQARFVVLNFPIGRLPLLEQRLSVYRQGLKVGEVKVTGPQRDDNIVGDMIAGEAQAGDEVRDR